MTDLQSSNILVVEDNKDDRFFIKRFFEQENIGNKVTVASGYGEAIELIQREHFDVAFLDVHLYDGPDEMAGLTLATRLRESGKTDVVMLSGSGDMSTVMDSRRVDALAFITKPLTRKPFDDVVQMIKRTNWGLITDRSKSA